MNATTIKNNELIDVFNDNYLLSRGFTYSEMNYDSDWDNLMRVVQKINKITYNFSNISRIDGFYFEHQLYVSIDIKEVYNACLEFIKQHNQQK